MDEFASSSFHIGSQNSNTTVGRRNGNGNKAVANDEKQPQPVRACVRAFVCVSVGWWMEIGKALTR